MNSKEQPANEQSKEERIEAHFTTASDHWNRHTFAIYESTIRSGLFNDSEIPLDAFSYAESFLHANRNKPLSVVRALVDHFNEQIPPFTDEQKRFMLDQLIRYFQSTIYTCPDGKEYGLDKVATLLKQELGKLTQPPAHDKAEVKVYDWSTTAAYLATLPDTSTKIAYLLMEQANYKQSFDGWDLGLGPAYDKQCQIEIKKLRDLAKLEQQGQAAQSTFKLSSKHGTKANLLRILNALYELRLIELEDSQLPTKEQFMKEIGGFMNVDMNRYEQALSKALEQSLESNLKVFDELKQAAQAQVLVRHENGRK